MYLKLLSKFGCLLCVLFSVWVSSCRNKVEHPVQFYYWKTNVNIGPVEKDYFEKLNSDKLYIRFFDVDKKDDVIQPLAKIRMFEASQLNAVYVPVVFITNRSFYGITEEKMLELAHQMSELIDTIQAKNGIPDVEEIQIDCDWTEKTRDVYFQFLQLFKQVSGKKISCTIRLHQIRDRAKTGVPPVYKGYLMCYATSDPKMADGKNSILDVGLLKSYTTHLDTYPLLLDMALPIYSWGIVTNHLGRIKLINQVTKQDLDPVLFEQKGENIYLVLDDCFFKGFYLNKGFTIQVEMISPDLLKEVREYLDHKMSKPYQIVYYHLDEPFLKQFSFKDLQ